jgi:hypothetical protein
MDLSHQNERLICGYKGVNGVNFHLIAQSFAPSLLCQLFESLSFIADSVSFRRSGSTPSCVASRRLDRLESGLSCAVLSAQCRIPIPSRSIDPSRSQGNTP